VVVECLEEWMLTIYSQCSWALKEVVQEAHHSVIWEDIQVWEEVDKEEEEEEQVANQASLLDLDEWDCIIYSQLVISIR